MLAQKCLLYFLSARHLCCTEGGLSAQWKKFGAVIWVNNLLNAKYETFGTFAPNAKRAGNPIEPFLTPAPPINVVAGLTYRF
jgi:outer membrane receptor protein involved in Fe transport